MYSRSPATAVVTLLGVAVCLWAAAFAFIPFESHDLWWHLRTGDLILTQGRPPARNLFSFTAPDFPWVTHEWLTEVLFFWLYSRLGPAALVALKVLLAVATFAVVYRTAWRESGSALAAAAATALCVYAARLTFDIRPHLVTYLFLAVTLAVIARQGRQGGRAVFVLVPLIGLWANLHSGFIAALTLLALAAVTIPAQARAFLGTLVLGAGAALINPSSWRILWFPIEVSRTGIFMESLTEWFSPNFQSSWLWGFEALLLTCFALFALSPARPRLFDIGALVLFAHLALHHQRHVPLFAIAAAPVLARSLAALLKPLAARFSMPSRVAVLAAALLVIDAACLLYSMRPDPNAFAAQTRLAAFPVAAVDYLERQPPTRLFNAYKWGGYLIWRLHPQQHVFIDGRADAYPRQVFKDYMAIHRLDSGWHELLDQYRIQTVLEPANSPLANALRRRRDWQLAYSDSVAAVYTRVSLPSGPGIP